VRDWREGKGALKKEGFGKTADGQSVDLYTLTTRSGVEVRITNYGAIVVSLKAPDRNGRLGDVVLGFETLDGYLRERQYFGAIIGRFANRISKATFTLDGTRYALAANDGENHLHGGTKGFDKVVWKARPLDVKDGVALDLTYRSPDGEEGYPGSLSVQVVYTLTHNDELRIDYSATTDKDTVVNLTHHSYFNLSGQPDKDILDHQVMINADRFTPVDSGLIPSGELRSVEGTPFDFIRLTRIGAGIDGDDEQLRFAVGYDHNFVLNGRTGALRLAAKVFEPTTGRVMEVWTTEPGLQFYSGNLLDGSIKGKGGILYGQRSGFCLEAQHFPDSPNNPNFPSTVLRRGDRFHTTTLYRFLTE
jgi:aldose 1-epimerase